MPAEDDAGAMPEAKSGWWSVVPHLLFVAGAAFVTAAALVAALVPTLLSLARLGCADLARSVLCTALLGWLFVVVLLLPRTGNRYSYGSIDTEDDFEVNSDEYSYRMALEHVLHAEDVAGGSWSQTSTTTRKCRRTFDEEVW